MSDKQSSNDATMALILVGCMIVFLILSAISAWAGLDISTTFKLIVAFGISTVIAVALVYAGHVDWHAPWAFFCDPVCVALLWLSALWVFFWMALDYWATGGFRQSEFSYLREFSTVWWNAWYFRWGVLIALIAAWIWSLIRSYQQH